MQLTMLRIAADRERRWADLPRIMDTNRIVTDGFSTPESGRLYDDLWPGEPEIAEQHEDGIQCLGCDFYARLNTDYGICHNGDSRHRLETVFEHFTCASHTHEPVPTPRYPVEALVRPWWRFW